MVGQLLKQTVLSHNVNLDASLKVVKANISFS